MGVFELVSIAKEYKAPIGWMVVKTPPACSRANRERSSKANQPITNEQLSYRKPLKKKKEKKIEKTHSLRVIGPWHSQNVLRKKPSTSKNNHFLGTFCFVFSVASFSHFLTSQTSSKPKPFSSSSAESSPEIASLA
jgi:hypothetical protein